MSKGRVLPQRKVVARRTAGGVEAVRYADDPPHRWHRVTPTTAAERGKYQQIADAFEGELRGQGLLPATPGLVELGGRIRAARLAAEMSLVMLADASGVEKAALSRLESGKNPNPSLRTLSKIAAALGAELHVTFAPNQAAG